jgi:hypothetical protein
MSRNFYGIEKGLDIYAENGALQVRILTGTAIPDGTSGGQDTAPIGSLYLRSGTSGTYEKIANAGAPADWVLSGSATIGKWRNEKIVVATNDIVAAGVRDLVANPFSDDDGTLIAAADFAVNDYVLADCDGTPVLMKVTAVSAPNVTFAVATPSLVAEDTFVVINYLPDPNGGENRAIVNYNGTICVKIADIDFSIATGINLSGSYVAASGNVAPSDSVETAIAKLDGVNDNQDTLLGTAQGATNLGTFTGATIPDNSTVKGALQSVETSLEEIDANVNDVITASGIAENATNYGTFTGNTLADSQTAKQLFQRIEVLLEQLQGNTTAAITTAVAVDSVPHATVKACKWLVTVSEDATPTNRKAYEIFAVNNGSAVDDNKVSILKVGSNFNESVSVDISGANMRLMISSSSAGITATVRRIEVIKTTL